MIFGDFQKGHVEENEIEIQTAVREIKEETGLSVEIIPEFRASTEFSCKKHGLNYVLIEDKYEIDLNIFEKGFDTNAT